MPIAFQADRSQYVEIIQAIETIGTQFSGLTFLGSKLYEMPQFTEIDAAGYPYFVVRFGRNVGWAQGGALQGGDTDMRGIGSVEPVWDFDVYALFNGGNDANFGDAATALVSLFWAYTANPDLGLGGDITCTLVEPQLTYVRFADGTNIAAKLTVRVYEALNVTPITS